MSRDGSGVYSLPAIYEAVSGETILATQHNTPLEDIEADLNSPRPLAAGGTGASTKQGAIDNFFSGTEYVRDDKFFIADPADTTKKIRIDAGNIATATTRVLTLPDADVAITALAAALLNDADADDMRTTLGVIFATEQQARDGTDNTTYMTPLRVAQAMAASFSPPDDEVGVVYSQFPVGDVRRYGVFPDAISILTASTTSGSPTISGSAGQFADVQIGMRVWGPNIVSTTTVLSKASDNSTVTVSNNATVTAAGTAKLIFGSSGITADSAKYAALAANGLNPNISLYFPPGLYADSWNMGAEYTGTADQPWRAHFDNAYFCGIFHIVAGCSHVRCTGTVGTYDRFGITGEGSEDIEFENVIGLHDVNLNNGTVGTAGNRGYHIVQCKNFRADALVLEDCEATTNDGTSQTGSLAGFAIEQGPSAFGFRCEKIWVKNSATHGVLLYGGDINIDHVQIDGYGKSPVDILTGGGIGALGLPDAEVATGFGARRATGRIERLEVRQGNASPSDTGQRAILLSDTGDVSVTDEVQKSISFGTIYAEVGSALASCGGNIAFGCPQVGGTSNNDVRSNYDIGLMEVMLRAGWSLDNATDDLITFYAPVTGGGIASYKIDKLRIISPQGYNAIGLTGATSDDRQLTIGSIDVLDFAGTSSLINMTGNVNGNTRVKIGNINFAAGSTAYTTRSVLSFDTLQKLTIDGIAASASAAVANSLLGITSCRDVSVNNVRGRNYNGVSAGCIALSGNTNLTMRGVDVVGTDATNSWGVFLSASTHAYYSFYDVYVTDFAVGSRKGGSPTFTNFAVSNSAALSCASASNLATGDTASKVNQSLVTP